MPAALSYPGVYVEEIPSGVRTITGVATSICAFIGRTQKGPVDEATDITSFADFERIFGGLWLDSKLSFAVRDFYRNGGSRAVIVRVFHPGFSRDPDVAKEERKAVIKPLTDALKAAKEVTDAALTKEKGSEAKTEAKKIFEKITADAGKIKEEKEAAKTAWDAIKELGDDDKKEEIAAIVETVTKSSQKAISDATVVRTIGIKDKDNTYEFNFEAANPGKWAGYLRIKLIAAESGTKKDAARRMGVREDDLFNLAVVNGNVTETFQNLTVIKSSRRIDKVLAGESNLIRWAGSNLDESSPGLPKFVVKDKDGKDVVNPVGDEVTIKQGLLDALLIANRGKPPTQEIKDAQAALDEAISAALNSVSDGADLEAIDFFPPNGEVEQRGLHALEQLYTRDGLFNLLCIPPYKSDDSVDIDVIGAAASYCEEKRAMLIVDPPKTWKTIAQATRGFSNTPDEIGTRSKNAAIFFPRIKQPNPFRDNQIEEFAPCGVVAGIFARTDTERGVWKAPAGIEAALKGVNSLHIPMTDLENGLLNPLGINCLRHFPVYGQVVWGARTLQGADGFASEWKYVPVRRTALFIEESLYRGTKWVVFEPNDEPLWAQIRLAAGAFMHNLFRLGAFQGRSPKEAYFVKCDSETTTQNDINLGIVNIDVGFMPLKPAEFVVIRLQQMAGQIEV